MFDELVTKYSELFSTIRENNILKTTEESDMHLLAKDTNIAFKEATDEQLASSIVLCNKAAAIVSVNLDNINKDVSSGLGLFTYLQYRELAYRFINNGKH